MKKDLMREDDFDDSIIPDEFFYFEIMDRASMLCNQIDHAFFNHPGLDEEHSKMAARSLALIAEIYQWAGRKMIDITST